MTTTTVYKVLDLGRVVVVMEETTISRVRPVDTLLANLHRELALRAGTSPGSVVYYAASVVESLLKKRGVISSP